MNLEEMFIKNCIIDSRQSRLLYELRSPKKRNIAIGRFAHGVDSLLRKECVLCETKPATYQRNFLGDTIWAIVLYDSGGRYVSEQEGIRMIDEENGPFIFVSPVGHAVIKNEDNELYLLAFKNKFK